jgi:hypothetical protein
MNLTGAVRLPKGTTAQRPDLSLVRTLGGADGFIRYNTDIDSVTGDPIGIEAYVDGVWEVVRAPGSGTITKQTLGPGDGVEQIFGPLRTEFEYKYTANLDNLIILVENVWQIAGTNVILIQNPCVISAPVIGFVNATSAITSSNTSEVNFKELGFFESQEIEVTGTDNNNGTYTISSVSPSEIVVEETLTDEAAGTDFTIIGNSPLTGLPYGQGFFLKLDDGNIVGKNITVYYGYAN